MIAPPLQSAPPPDRPRLRARIRRVEGAPVVAIRALVPAGARREPVAGQAYLTGRMLSEGTRQRDYRRLAEELEARGMMLSTAGSWETHGLSLDALAGDWERALEWTAELLLEPTFPPDRVAWACRQIGAELESLADRPEVLCGWAFQEQLYAPHPRGRRLQGEPATLQRLEAADCSTFHRRAFASGLILSVTGDLDEEAVGARLESLLGGDPAALDAAALEPTADAPDRGPLATQLPPPDDAADGARREVALHGTDQAHLLMGHLTVPRAHPDYPALELLAVVLGAGSGLTGRIPNRIREQEGLAYTATAQTVSGAGLDPGHLVFYVGTSPATVDQAERGVREELVRLLAAGLEPGELEDARSYLLGREPFRRETAGQWARLLAEAEVYGLPLEDSRWREESLRAPSAETVLEVARRHLDPARLRVTVGLPAGPRGEARE